MNRVILGTLMACLVLSVASGHGPGQGPDVLVVDLAHVVEQCKEQGDLVGAVRKQADNLQEKYAGQVKELQARYNDLLRKVLSQRDAKWYKEVEQALLDEGRLKAIEAHSKLEMADEIARGMEALMISAKQAAKAIMKQRKAKMVMVSKMSPIKLDTESDFKDELLNRRVLVADKAVDITAEVLKRMDEAYAKRKKKG